MIIRFQILCFAAAIFFQMLATEPAHATDTASSEAPGASYEEGWWRHVRQASWIWSGANWNIAEQALNRIKEAEGERRYEDKFDTIIQYGPGHWTYEWRAIAQRTELEAQEHEKKGDNQQALASFLESSIYYTLASYPHSNNKHSREALKKGFENYKRAGQHFAVPLEVWDFEVDGASFSAFLHLPKNMSDSPVPVVLKTSGMDVVSTEAYPLTKTLNEAGVAAIVFDVPGTGNDGVVDANYEKHHLAVLDKVWGDQRFDDERLAIWSDSLAGGLPVKLAVGEHRNRIAAAINNCGIVHAAFSMDLLGGIGIDKSKLISAYEAGTLSPDVKSKFDEAMASPRAQALLKHFQGELLIERLGADPDDLLSFLSKGAPVSLVNQGVLGKKNITNTPILVINTHDDPFVPHEESVLAADVSVQGKLMVIDDYAGHCVARSEWPQILEWLSYHLKVSELGGYVETNRGR